MSFDDQLKNLLAGLTLSPSGTMVTQPGALATVQVLPPLDGLSLSDALTTTVTMIAKSVRFSLPELPVNDPAGASDDVVIGGQPMPSLIISLPGAPLPGALSGLQLDFTGGLGLPLTSPPVDQLTGSITGIPAGVPGSAPGAGYQPTITPPAPSGTDLLSGVPGLIGRLSGLPVGMITAPVHMTVHWTLTDQANNIVLETDAGPNFSFLPPIAFSELSPGPPGSASFKLTAKVTLSVANANGQTLNLPPLKIQVPQIPVPRLLAVSTWVKYGATPIGHTDWNDNALLIAVPTGSPLLVSQSSLTNLLSATQSTLGAIAGIAVTPGVFVAGAGLAEAAALAYGIGQLLMALGTLPGAAGDYQPYMVIVAASNNSLTIGPPGDVRFDLEDVFHVSHDHWCDMCESVIYLTPPNSNSITLGDEPHNPDSTVDFLTITTGTGGFAGIPDLRHPDVIDQLQPTSLPPGVTWTPPSTDSAADHWWGDSDLAHGARYRGIYTIMFN